jgi:hypothetical protein
MLVVLACLILFCVGGEPSREGDESLMPLLRGMHRNLEKHYASHREKLDRMRFLHNAPTDWIMAMGLFINASETLSISVIHDTHARLSQLLRHELSMIAAIKETMKMVRGLDTVVDDTDSVLNNA